MNKKFYTFYLSKWENENSSYFQSFREKFPIISNSLINNKSTKYIILLVNVVAVVLIIVFIYFNFIHPNDIPSVWYGLLASIMGLLLGTALYPTKIITPSADQ